MPIPVIQLIKWLLIGALGYGSIEGYKAYKTPKNVNHENGRTALLLDVTGPTDTKVSVPTPSNAPVKPVKSNN